MMSIPEAEHEALQESEELCRQVELQRELKKEARKGNESQLALIFNGVSDLLFLIGVEAGPQFRCLAVNHSYLKGTGRTQEQMEGKLIEEILPPEEARFVIANYLKAMQSRSPTTYEESADVPAGRLVVETTLTPVFDEQGNCTHLLGASRDITERKRMVKALRRSEARYRTVSELVSDYAYAVRLEPDGRGILEWVTEAFSRITGFTVQDLAAGIGLDRLIHPEDMPRVYQRLSALFTGQSGVSEHRIVTKSGEVRWLRDYSCPEWDPAQGRVVRVIGAGQDITEWKQTEEALRESEERYRNLFENANDAIATFTLDGTITAVNRAAERLLGWSREEMVGQHVSKVATPASVALAEERAQRFLAGERLPSAVFEAELVHKDGSVVMVEARTRAIRDAAGKPVGFQGIYRDITERKQAEKQLKENEAQMRQLQSELAHVNRAITMGEMAASIAHEVNQPLGAIVGNADICLRWLASETPDLDQVCDALSDIIKDGHRASEVIARIRALVKKGVPKRTSLNMNEVLREAVALASHEVQRKRVILRIEFAADLPSVFGDRIQLGQVMLNLIMNGIEAMSGIKDRERELVIKSDRDGMDGVLIAVQDCGVGIDPQGAKRMFAPFYTIKPEGMGMGLAICRSIVEAHGGRLWVAPNVGAGVTFQFTLPFGCQEER